MTQPLSSRENRTAFTLVEMLVSVAVLVLLMTFVAQMLDSTMLSTTLSGKHMDTDGEARLVFDRMAVDFGRMLRRNDVDFVFSKQPDPDNTNSTASTSGSSDEMFFYSETPAYPASTSGTNTNSTVALAGYYVYTTGTNPVTPDYSLLRLSKGLTWESATSGTGPYGVLFLTSTSPNSFPLPATSLSGSQGSPNYNGAIGFNPGYAPADLTDYDVLSSEVFRMEFCFQVKDLSYLTNSNATRGTVYSNYPIAYFQTSGPGKATNTRSFGTPPIISSTSTASAPFVGDRYYDPATNRAYVCTGFTTTLSGLTTYYTPIWTPNGMSDVTAIVVAIAILDKNSRNLVPNLGTLAGALPDPTEDTTLYTSLQAQPPHLMAETWQNAITSGTFAASAGIPQVAASQIRVYQRFFYLNNN